MNKLVALLMLAPSIALAEPSPYGSSPYVVAYNPPPIVDSSHRGLTLEVALGGSTVDSNHGAVTFAIGGWLNRELALAFRASVMGNFDLAAVSAQYDVTPRLWLGAGLGSLRERYDDLDMSTQTGFGGFARVGFQLANSGSHALYLSAELQVGSVGNDIPIIGSLLLGYQML